VNSARWTGGESRATEQESQGGAEKADEVPASWIRAEAQKSLAGKHADKRVWEYAPLNLGSDLHPYIRRLLGARGVEADQAHARAFRLTNEGRRLVHGQPLAVSKEATADERQPAMLELELRPNARNRIANRLGDAPSCDLRLVIQDMRLVFFRTGHAIVVVEVAFKRSDDAPLHPCWVVEGVHSLARFNTLGWCAASGARDDGPMFSFGRHTCRDLAGDIEGSGSARGRVFTANLCQSSQQTPEADLPSRRLAVPAQSPL